jgi:hypothetical protein
LAAALQEWSAQCIAAHLETVVNGQQREDLLPHLKQEKWQIHHKGKDFLGGRALARG